MRRFIPHNTISDTVILTEGKDPLIDIIQLFRAMCSYLTHKIDLLVPRASI